MANAGHRVLPRWAGAELKVSMLSLAFERARHRYEFILTWWQIRRGHLKISSAKITFPFIITWPRLQLRRLLRSCQNVKLSTTGADYL